MSNTIFENGSPETRILSCLFEAVEIGLSKKAYDTLSQQSKDAIDDWERSGWIDGLLVKALDSNSEIAKEIYNAFAPIRESLKKRYKNGIRLYRGLLKGKLDNFAGRRYESWTTDKRIAEVFANLRSFSPREGHPLNVLKPVTNDEIKATVEKYNKVGYATFRGRIYRRNKDNPDFYDIYTSKSRSHVTDGDDLETELRDLQKEYAKMNKEKLDKSTVLKKIFPIDKIVWITNRLNSKEFIVRV